MLVLLDKNNYINSYNLMEDIVDEGWIQIENPSDMNLFEQYYYAFRCVDGKLVIDDNRINYADIENQKNKIRMLREQECFKIIDRSPLWYEQFDEWQMQSIKEWYEDWLVATITLKIPPRPAWLDDYI